LEVGRPAGTLEAKSSRRIYIYVYSDCGGGSSELLVSPEIGGPLGDGYGIPTHIRALGCENEDQRWFCRGVVDKNVNRRDAWMDHSHEAG